MKHVLLDFDGVIAKSFDSDIKFQKERFGLTSEDAIESARDHHHAIPKRHLTQEEWHTKIASTREWNHGIIKHGAKLFLGALSAIKLIRSKKIQVGIMSNGTFSYIQRLLSSEIDTEAREKLFNLGIWGVDHHEDSSPEDHHIFHAHKASKLLHICNLHNLNLEDIVYVGDTFNDYHALVGEGLISPKQFFASTYGGIHDHSTWKQYSLNFEQTNYIHKPKDLLKIII